MSSNVTSEKPFSATSRKAAFRSASRRSASWLATAGLGMPGYYLTSQSGVNLAFCNGARQPRLGLLMNVHVLHFASFREAVGLDEERRELPEGTRVSELWQNLCRQVPLF